MKVMKLPNNLNVFFLKNGIKSEYGYVYDLVFTHPQIKNLFVLSLIGKNVLDKFEYFLITIKNKKYFYKLEKPISTKKFLTIFIKLCKKKLNSSLKKEKLSSTVNSNPLEDIEKHLNNIESSVKTESLNSLQTFNKLYLWSAIISAIVTVILSVIFLSMYLFTKVKKIYLKAESFKNEQKVLEKLFSSHSLNDPAFENYSYLTNSIVQLVKQYKNKNLHIQRNAIIVGGPPGLGKSYMVKRILYLLGLKIPNDFIVIKGTTNTNLSKIIQILYEFRKKIIVFDDFDDFFVNSIFMNLAKNITELARERTIYYPEEKTSAASSHSAAEGEVPERFIFSGKVIFLTNIPKEKIDPAIISRAGYINVDFSIAERIKLLEKMMKFVLPEINMDIKKEVYFYIVSLFKEYPKAVDFRFFENAICLKITFPNEWKTIVREFYYNL